MMSNTAKHLEALSTEEWIYFKNVAEAFEKGAPLRKDILSNASKELQELLIQVDNLLLPKPQVFSDIYDVMVYKDPIKTMRKAKLAYELYKKFGLPHGELQAIFSASERTIKGATEVFCGKPVYKGEGHPGYCPIRADNVFGSIRDHAFHEHWGEEGFGVWETKQRVREVNNRFEDYHPLKEFSSKCKGCIYYNNIHVDPDEFLRQ